MSLTTRVLKLTMITSLMLTATIASANSLNVKVQCGDLNEAYVDLDLSESFKEQFAEEAQDESYDYLVAGRNCGLESWQSKEEYEVLVMFKKKALGDHVGLGPFTIKPLDITFFGDKESTLNKIRSSEGVILSGINKDGVHGDGLSASLETKRGSGFVKIILRKIK